MVEREDGYEPEEGFAFLVIALMARLTATGAGAEELMDASGQWTYVLKDGGATITGFVEEPSGDLAIPNELDGYPVTGIGECTLDYRSLTSVTIPDSIVEITPYSFSYCRTLERIEVAPDNPAFESTDGVLFDKRFGMLMACPTTRAGITKIGEWAFLYCRSLTSVASPSSVTSIGLGAFVACDSLTSVTIPTGVTSIGDDAFGVESSPNLILAVAGGSYAESGDYREAPIGFYSGACRTGRRL